MAQRVAVLGGGVGGLTAAHELIERGFEVVVFEARIVPGGKSRSFPKPGSGTGGLKELPAEHGFRFFPGFYRHLPDTMQRIPFGAGSTVAANLVPAEETMLARVGAPAIHFPAHFPETIEELGLVLSLLFQFHAAFGIPAHEVNFFCFRLLQLMTSCEERRFAQYEQQDWWTFIDAENRSTAYRKYLADGLCRSLVAVQPQQMSARTGGYTLLQFLFDFTERGVQLDRVLNGPTNDAWIDPWLVDLRNRGVDYQNGARVESIQCDGRRITAVEVTRGVRRSSITADFYVAALPVEVMQRLLSPPMLAADPGLAGIRDLRTEWMTGLLFYLRRDLRVVRGHINFVDSPWALTGIFQQQFWPDVRLAECDAGEVRGILSTIISAWDREGVLIRKPASQCSEQEIKDEVWHQVKLHLNARGTVLRDEDRHDSFLDPAIRFANGRPVANDEPLLVNVKQSWAKRPEARTGIENFFLAADYVRTHTDLATMEAANEAARRAVNGILAAAGSTATRCDVWPLREPRILAPALLFDRGLFELGLPHAFPPSFQHLDLFPGILAAGSDLPERLG